MATYGWVHSGLLSPATYDSILVLGLCAVGLVLLYVLQSRKTTTGRRDYLHLVGAALAITVAVHCLAVAALLFPLQTWQGLRNRHLALHRLTGRIALVSLAVGLAAGMRYCFPLITKHTGGALASDVALFCQSVSALSFGLLGWRAARASNIPVHQAWMTRLVGVLWGSFGGSRILHLAGIEHILPACAAALNPWALPSTHEPFAAGAVACDAASQGCKRSRSTESQVSKAWELFTGPAAAHNIPAG
ncbi:hypothetical protein WJX72_008883 [[Myrmecia] bisecta]|uniref:Cytochrome b561 domain-containing protein n=1 Tax=[Myrmecia] bisecta TaxID=41462 RepID=A0AAW1PQE9_9CHLO